MSGPESGRAAGLPCQQSVGAPTGERRGGLGLRRGRFPLALPLQSLPRPLAWLEQGRGRPRAAVEVTFLGPKRQRLGSTKSGRGAQPPLCPVDSRPRKRPCHSPSTSADLSPVSCLQLSLAHPRTFQVSLLPVLTHLPCPAALAFPVFCLPLPRSSPSAPGSLVSPSQLTRASPCPYPILPDRCGLLPLPAVNVSPWQFPGTQG